MVEEYSEYGLMNSDVGDIPTEKLIALYVKRMMECDEMYQELETRGWIIDRNYDITIR
jgi:hypothetical protein